jgi:hypothetical protein
MNQNCTRPARRAVHSDQLNSISIEIPYGVQLWGSASKSNIEILERCQSKVSRIITNAPWYVSIAVIVRDLQVLSVR